MVYKNVNKSVPRIEGAEKVSGKMRYAADFDFPNALAAKILRTSLPHAKILSIDTSKALKLRGVRAVITGDDVGSVMVGLRMKDMPLLATDRVRYVGEPVAAVAADTDEIAEEALNLIDVQYQELPYVTDPVEATRPGAPVLHDNPAAYKNAPEREIDLPNVQSYGKWSNGDLAAGFKKAARVFEHTFRTPLGFHGYIEPHACTVQIHDNGRVEIWASNKAPFTLRARFARDLAPPSRGDYAAHGRRRGQKDYRDDGARGVQRRRLCGAQSKRGSDRPGAAPGRELLPHPGDPGRNAVRLYQPGAMHSDTHAG